MDDFEMTVAWAIRQGFATGHAENLDSLLDELAVQIDELREKAWKYDDLCK